MPKKSGSKKRKLSDQSGPKSKKMKVDGDSGSEKKGNKITGVCKKWLHDKGYGFVTRDDGKGDVMTHIKDCVVKGDQQNIKVGSKVQFEVEKGDKGDFAVNVTAVGGGPCEGGFQLEGKITRWEVVIEGDDGETYFATKGNVESTSFGAGRRVQFDINPDENGDKKLAAYIIKTGESDDEDSEDESEDDEDATPSDGKQTGVCVSWRHESGFGFIKPDDGEKELFVHRENCSLKDEGRNIRVGSKVEFRMESGEKGDTAVDVAAVGGGDCKVGCQMKGKLTKWLQHRGFGFIKGDDGNEYFIGDRDLWTDDLEQGDRVQFDIKKKADGKLNAVYANEVGGRYYRSKGGRNQRR